MLYRVLNAAPALRETSPAAKSVAKRYSHGVMQLGRLLVPVLAASGIVALGAACSGKTAYAGALMVAIQTDLAAPKDVSAVGLYISSDEQRSLAIRETLRRTER